jgi:hypothetical protein
MEHLISGATKDKNQLGTITYFKMSGTNNLDITSYGSIQEVHTVRPGRAKIDVYTPKKGALNPFRQFVPGESYIVYSKRFSSDFKVITNGPTPNFDLNHTISGEAYGKPNVLVYNLGKPLAAAPYGNFIKVLFWPNTAKTMLRAWIPGVTVVVPTFEQGRGYTIYAKQNFTIQEAALPTSTPAPTAQPRPTATPTVPPPTATTPITTPTATIVPEAFIQVNIVSSNIPGGPEGAFAIVEYNEEWANPENPNANWRPLTVSRGNLSTSIISLPKRKTDGVTPHDGKIQFRVRGVEAGTTWRTDASFDLNYRQMMSTSNGSSSLYVTNTTPGTTKTVTIYLEEYGSPTQTPLPTATPSRTPNPTATPPNTPLPTATPSRTPNPTATPAPTPTVPPNRMWEFDDDEILTFDNDYVEVMPAASANSPAPLLPGEEVQVLDIEPNDIVTTSDTYKIGTVPGVVVPSTVRGGMYTGGAVQQNCAAAGTARNPRYVSITGSTEGIAWGSNGVYTDDSSLPRAAVHAGLLAVGQTGVFEIISAGWRATFPGSLANGIQSAAYSSGWCGIQLVRLQTLPNPTTQQPHVLLPNQVILTTRTNVVITTWGQWIVRPGITRIRRTRDGVIFTITTTGTFLGVPTFVYRWM